MLRSLYSGVSGLSAHQTRMDVIGNNIANVNTYGFKASRVTFSDIYYQTMRNATGGSATTGGNNPSQVGYGVKVGSIDTNMGRSGFQSTDNGLDLSIAGEGFFQVQDKAGNRFYTRAGILGVDNNGNLVDSKGNFVLGVTGDPKTQTTGQSNKIQLIVPDVQDAKASADKTLLGSKVTIEASDVGKDGNITVNFVNGNPPTSTLSGDNLTITFDQSAKYNDMTSLQAAIDEAIKNGGVTLPAGALKISVDPAPTDTKATATNYADFAGGQKFTVTAGDYGKTGNNISVKYKTVAAGGTASAEWKGDDLIFTLDEDHAYTEDELKALVTAANTAAGVTTGDAKNVTLALTGGTITGKELAEKPLKLGGGDNTYFENIAGLLGTIKMDGGCTAAAQTAGNLQGLSIGSDGVITASHAIHGQLTLGRIDLVTFDNPSGLEQSGNTYFKQTVASGDPKACLAGMDGSGDIVSNALEMSNVDLAQEFADMITTQRGFQANSRIITTSDEMLQELVNLKR